MSKKPALPKAIYTPKGAAAEYAELAFNGYSGCSGCCKYCYVPACLRKTPEAFQADPKPRPRILEALERDAKKLQGTKKRVLMSFTCDPYQPIEREHEITRQAIKIMGKYGIPMSILTKFPKLAWRDMDLFKKYNVHAGVSLVWLDDKKRKLWEPGTGSIAERVNFLGLVRDADGYCWVSMEPVIESQEAWCALVTVSGFVDMLRIGKINHNKDLAAGVDWAAFTKRAIAICEEYDQPYIIKDSLKKYVPA